jgi:hypothetical protein
MELKRWEAKNAHRNSKPLTLNSQPIQRRPGLGRLKAENPPKPLGHPSGSKAGDLAAAREKCAIKNAQARRSQAEKSARALWAFGWLRTELLAFAAPAGHRSPAFRCLKNAQARRSQAEKSAKPVWAFGWLGLSRSSATRRYSLAKLASVCLIKKCPDSGGPGGKPAQVCMGIRLALCTRIPLR